MFPNDNYAAYQPWSVGVRNCIGKNLAYAELRLMLAKVLWHYVSIATSINIDQD